MSRESLGPIRTPKTGILPPADLQARYSQAKAEYLDDGNNLDKKRHMEELRRQLTGSSDQDEAPGNDQPAADSQPTEKVA